LGHSLKTLLKKSRGKSLNESQMFTWKDMNEENAIQKLRIASISTSNGFAFHYSIIV